MHLCSYCVSFAIITISRCNVASDRLLAPPKSFLSAAAFSHYALASDSHFMKLVSAVPASFLSVVARGIGIRSAVGKAGKHECESETFHGSSLLASKKQDFPSLGRSAWGNPNNFRQDVPPPLGGYLVVSMAIPSFSMKSLWTNTTSRQVALCQLMFPNGATRGRRA